MEVLNTFGLQPILLLAQIVNFLVLLFILKKFLYKPILKVLDERKAKIENSIHDAEEIEKRLVAIESEREDKINKAVNEARGIVNEARKNAETIIADAHHKAEKDIQDLTKKAKDSLALERDKLHQEIKKELANMIVLGLEKVAGKVLTSSDQKDLVKETIQHLS